MVGNSLSFKEKNNMSDKLKSLEGFDSGSNYKFGNKMQINKNPRSLFDLSHLNTLTMNNAGKLIPIALWETLPSDDFDINVDCLLRVLPQVVPLYSRQRMYIYGFYSRYSDLWNNWQVFMDKGYTGNVDKKIPHLYKTPAYKNVNWSSNEKIVPDSLFDYMGLPIGIDMADMFDGATTNHCAYISALPFMMYLRIYRDYFMNKNHWIKDRVMLPDDDSRFRLDDNGWLLSAKDLSKDIEFGQYDDITISGNTYKFGLLYHDYPDDYFTSALPFTQRGTAAKLNWSVDVSDITATSETSFDTLSLINYLNTTSPAPYDTLYGTQSANTPLALVGGGTPQQRDLDIMANVNTKFTSSLNDKVSTITTLSGDTLTLGITLEDIRKLAIEQQELEQLARTDGSYRQFGLSFFGETSRAAYDFRPTYIGGTYKNIAFTEVLQTSGQQLPPSEGEDAGTPLGAYAGHGISGISNGRIGHIHCDDYGMIMLIACIMPDVYYSQGLDRIFTDRFQSEKFMPERAKLGMQPIYNKELYYAGNNTADEGHDNYLWAYQNPFDYLRYIPNKIHGKIADTSNNSFYPYTQARHFTQLPNWGRAFSNASDVRKDYLASAEEDAYSAQFNINIRAVRPLPYRAIPAELVH